MGQRKRSRGYRVSQPPSLTGEPTGPLPYPFNPYCPFFSLNPLEILPWPLSFSLSVSRLLTLAMVREDLITNAISFLQDPSVASSPLETRRAFLQSKNLTSQEIDVALARTSSEPAQPPPQSSYSQAPTQQQYIPAQQYGQYPPPWAYGPPP